MSNGFYFSDAWVRDRTGRHRSTISRWRQAGRFPPELVRLAKLELDGELALIHARWADWHLDRKTGELVTPGGTRIAPAEIELIPIHLQRLTELTRLENNVRGTARDPSRPLRAVLLGLARRLLAGSARRRRR